MAACAEAEAAVAEGEFALRVEGDLTAARSSFFRAYELAERAGDDRLRAAAALGLGGLWVHEHRPVADAAMVEACQRAALAALEPDSLLALRLRARLAAESDYRAGGGAAILGVLDEARDTGDPVTVSEALSLAHHCLLGPEHAERRLELAGELMREGSRTHRPSDAVMGLLWRTADLFLLGAPHAERSFVELSGSEDANRNAAVGYVTSAMRVMLAIRAGRLSEAERLAQDSAERGKLAGDVDDLGWYGGQLAAIRWFQGRIAELVEPLSQLANSPLLSATDNAFLPALAVAAATAGDLRTARGALAKVCGDDLGSLPRSSSWLIAMSGVVEAAALLDDAGVAARAYELLLPYARLPSMGSLAIVCVGSVHHTLGVASLTLGESGRALDHFRAALDRNTALGHWPAAVLSRHRLARTLALRGATGQARAEFATAAAEASALDMKLPAHKETGAAEVATCVRYGRGWRIALGARSAVVADSVGARCLATLIARPGVEISAADLAERGDVDAERARIAVGKAIRRALDRVAEADPVLGEKLRAGTRTGMRCGYHPVTE